VNDVPKNGRFGYYGVDGYYNDSNDTGSSRRMTDFQKSAIAGKRRELCARLGNSSSQNIVEIASPKKKTAAVTTASDKTKSLNNSGSKNISEKQIMLTKRKKAVSRHKEPAEAYDGT
jgi:hypothetical protein